METLRQGTAPPVIRRKGAGGALPVRREEKIEILALLAQDQEEEIRERALNTLRTCSAQDLESALTDTSVPPSELDFLLTHVLSSCPELISDLLEKPTLPESVRQSIQASLAKSGGEASSQAAGTAEAAEGSAAQGDQKQRERETLLQRVNRMSAAEKIKTALTGSQDERLILIRDSNKVVARAVLQSPKVSDQEAENYASMKNVTEEVLRLIAVNRKFMKSYAVLRQLVNNPRTPIDVSLPLINRLNDRDLKGLMLNKNVPEVIRSMSQKMVKQKEEAAKSKLKIGKH